MAKVYVPAISDMEIAWKLAELLRDLRWNVELKLWRPDEHHTITLRHPNYIDDRAILDKTS